MLPDPLGTPEAGDPSPASDRPVDPDHLPLSDDDLTDWKARLDAGRQLNKERRETWKRAVDAYRGKYLKSLPTKPTVCVPKEYSFVEQKKAEIAYRAPEVIADPTRPDFVNGAPVMTAVMNYAIGPYGVDLDALQDRLLFDVFTCGIGVSVLGYQAFTRDVEQPILIPGPAPMAPSPAAALSTEPPPMGAPGPPSAPPGAPASPLAAPLAPLAPLPPPPEIPLTDANGEPVMRTVPHVIYERYFWDWVNPALFICPHDFRGGDFDKAAWLAIDEDIPATPSNKQRDGIPEDYTGRTPDESETDLSGEKRSLRLTKTQTTYRRTRVWYVASLFDPQVDDPRLVRELTICEGLDHAARHRNAQYQRVPGFHEPEPGVLWDGQKFLGTIGFPLEILTIRDLPGAAYPMSDVEVTLDLTEELSKGRSQMLELRDKAVPLRTADVMKLGDEKQIAHLKSLGFGDVIATLGPGHEVFSVLAPPSYPPEDFEFNRIVDRDISEAWALDANARGMTNATNRTATEANAVIQSANVRLDKERARYARFVARGVQKLSALYQLYATDERYVEIVGPDNVKRLEPWNRQKIAGEFLFRVKPNSAQRPDIGQDRKEVRDLYQFTANDPNINRVALSKDMLTKFGYDPAAIVVEQLPPKPPEHPKLSISIKPEDFIGPQAEIAALIAGQYGFQIPPDMLARAQQTAATQAMAEQAADAALEQAKAPYPRPHGGIVRGAPPLSKKASDLTGELTGVTRDVRGY